MRNFITYIRKNIVFVCLLSILLMITIGAGIFLWINQKPTIEPQTPPVQEPTQEEIETTISSLEGSYSKNGEVRITWSIKNGKQAVKSVRLYHGDKALGGEMNALTSYTLSQNLYQFPTGDNTFTLKVTLENGEEISKDVNVFIDYILDMQMSYEQEGNKVNLHLTYRYDDANPVSIPRIKFLDNASLPVTFTYVETTRESSQGITTAITTFSIDIKNVKEGTYEAMIRWIFDGLNSSKDFPITIKR